MDPLYTRDLQHPTWFRKIWPNSRHAAVAMAPLHRLYRIRPWCPAGPNATGLARLTMVLEGHRHISWPVQGTICEHRLGAGEAIVVDPHSWSRPNSSRSPHRYVSIDCYPSFTRFMCLNMYRSGSMVTESITVADPVGGSSVICLHAMLLLQRQDNDAELCRLGHLVIDELLATVMTGRCAAVVSCNGSKRWPG